MIRRLHVPLAKPEDVIPHLAKQELHWRAGYSAQELAVAWADAGNSFPASVRSVLKTAPEYAEAELVDAFFEREVELRTPGRNSQTDLMVVAGLGSELGIIAVEGKVEESFADPVIEWNTLPGKHTRLERLCATVGVRLEDASDLRYQLFHRTASAVYEAHRYRCHHALMLVHSFSSTHRWFEDFAAFARAMGIPVDQPDKCSPCQGLRRGQSAPRLGERQCAPSANRRSRWLGIRLAPYHREEEPTLLRSGYKLTRHPQ